MVAFLGLAREGIVCPRITTPEACCLTRERQQCGLRPQHFENMLNGSNGPPAEGGPWSSDLNRLRDHQGVLQLDAEIPDSAVHLRMPQ